MRKLRKLLALALGMLMALSLMSLAYASDGDTQNDDTIDPYGGRWPTWQWPYGDELETEPAPDQYYYWVTDFLDETPTIVRNYQTGEWFLKFNLSKVSKIARLYDTYRAAFWLDENLTMLEQRSNASNALWAPIPWRTNFTIGTMLTETTKMLIRENYAYADAETVLKYIKTRPEYSDTDFLHNDVDYYLSTLSTYRRDVIAGLNQLYPDVAKENMTDAQLLNLARQYLQTNGTPIRQYLGAAKRAITALPASNPLLLRDLAPKEFNELYTGVAWVASRYWQDEWRTLNEYAVVVPLAVRTIYPWAYAG